MPSVRAAVRDEGGLHKGPSQQGLEAVAAMLEF